MVIVAKQLQMLFKSPDAVMATSQVALHLKNSLDFSFANHLDKKSELLLTIKQTSPFSRPFSNFVLSGPKKAYRGCKKSRTSCTSEGTLISVERRSSGVVEAASSSAIMESIATTSTSVKGLGIVDFMKDKNFLITGVTGFVAKVLIEKILRMQPEVGKLFLIIRAEDSASASKRLKNEVFDTELFKGLREKYGNEFHKFMLTKLVPVAGDMTQHNLGIKEDIADVLIKEVDIIVSSAANTTFDERFDTSNLEKLFQGLCEEEKENFGFDVKNIEWRNYFGNIHMHGLRQHVMKGRGAGKRLTNISPY